MSLEWGETVYTPKQKVPFTFDYKLHGVAKKMEVDISIPVNKSVEALASRLVTTHSVPCYMKDNLVNSLDTFVREQTRQMQKTLKDRLFESLKETGVKVRWIQFT